MAIHALSSMWIQNSEALMREPDTWEEKTFQDCSNQNHQLRYQFSELDEAHIPCLLIHYVFLFLLFASFYMPSWKLEPCFKKIRNLAKKMFEKVDFSSFLNVFLQCVTKMV